MHWPSNKAIPLATSLAGTLTPLDVHSSPNTTLEVGEIVPEASTLVSALLYDSHTDLSENKTN